MDFDISEILNHWDYEPGGIAVRKFIGKDGQEKIQLRVDLGILQMNAQGRPDGKKPMGHASLLEFYQSRLKQHQQAHNGDDDDFALTPEDCTKLQLEALQYHHRSICLLQMSDHPGVKRDTERNLAVFDFVNRFAESQELAWSLQQFRPQLLMMHTRAVATPLLQANDFKGAIQRIEDGMETIREFYRELGRGDLVEESNELLSLEDWLQEVQERRPLSKRERLERQLQLALEKEDYEKAADVRDKLKKLGGE
ncbi:MAG: UvrB/UvrC motif-containing protein [Verrucomicrobia bacterium]|nr:UvrB/UvrC motif-containing protein [Verrucomicrobiota bacterium]